MYFLTCPVGVAIANALRLPRAAGMLSPATCLPLALLILSPTHQCEATAERVIIKGIQGAEAKKTEVAGDQSTSCKVKWATHSEANSSQSNVCIQLVFGDKLG